MEILEIKVSRKTRMIDLPKDFTSIDGENLQSKFVFSFSDEFVEGQARLEYEKNGEKNYVILTRENNTYTTFLTNVITKEGIINVSNKTKSGFLNFKNKFFTKEKAHLLCKLFYTSFYNLFTFYPIRKAGETPRALPESPLPQSPLGFTP